MTSIPDFTRLKKELKKHRESWRNKTLCIDVLNVLLRKVNISEELGDMKLSRKNRTVFEYIVVDHKITKPEKQMTMSDLVKYN